MLERVMMVAWCMILILLPVMQNVQSVSADNTEELKITVNTMPKVDVSLALGVTDDSGEHFSEDLARMLKDRGIDPSVVSIQALESREEETFQGKFKLQIYWANNGSDMDSHTIFKSNGVKVDEMFYGKKSVFGSTLDIDDRVGGTGEWSTIDFDGVPENVDEIAFEVNPWSGSANTSVRLIKEMDGVDETLIDWSTHVSKGSGRTYFGSLKRNNNDGWDFHYRDGSIFDGSQTVITAKDFTEVLRGPVWRDNTSRFIVNMNDDVISDFDDSMALGEILTRLTNENIDYIGVGSNRNQTQSQNFIKRNDNRGKFINSDSRNYEQYMNDVADYIYEQVRLNQTEGASQYVLANQEIEMEVYPEELKTNTATELFPNGRWRMDHDENYFENGNGRYSRSGMYQPDLDVKLDKIGRYELWFGDLHPEPRYIYVHRKPIASFQLGVVASGSNRLITVTDRSYDLDNESASDKGIAEHEWKWKETLSSTWTNGMIPNSLPGGKDYIVQLRVKDHQGAWSDAEAQYVTTNTVVTKPIASFDAPYESSIYRDVSVEDISYDPSGRAITAREWIVTNVDTGKVVHSSSTPLTNFRSQGEGTYSIQLRVRNDANLWSDTFQRMIDIIIPNEGLDLTIPIIEDLSNVKIPEETNTFYTKFASNLIVDDKRRTEEGWSLKVSASPLKSSGYTFPEGSLHLGKVSGGTYSDNNTGTAQSDPSYLLNNVSIVDKGSIVVVKANRGQGMEKYNFTFDNNALGITIDPTKVKKGMYTSTFTWTLENVPS